MSATIRARICAGRPDRTSAMIVLVHPSLPRTPSRADRARQEAQPGKLNYASAGGGSGIHLGAELFQTMAGIELTHVPYKGAGPALTDLLGGHVPMYFSSLPSAMPGQGRQGAGARGDQRQALDRSSRTCRRWRRPLPASRRAALRHRRAGGHAAPDHRQAQRRAAARLSPPRTIAHGPRRSRAGAVDPRNTRPTSTARRPSGRISPLRSFPLSGFPLLP